MATAKSDVITNLDANPIVVADSRDMSGFVKVAKAHFAAGTGDIDDSDVILLARLPMAAKIVSIKLFNDDLDSNGTPTLASNLGLYYGGDNGLGVTKGAVIDEDCYATAIATLQAANTSGVELAYEVRNIANHGQEIWQDGGLTANPGGWADIALTISNVAATAAAGDILLVVEYVDV